MDPDMDVSYISVAGISHRQKTAATAMVGDECKLLPEPTNPHDPNAVRVVLKKSNMVLGYIPRSLSGVVAGAIEAGAKFKSTISFVGPTSTGDGLWVQIEVRIEEPSNV